MLDSISQTDDLNIADISEVCRIWFFFPFFFVRIASYLSDFIIGPLEELVSV